MKEYEKRYHEYLINHVNGVVNAWVDIRPLLIDENIITANEALKIDQQILKHDASKFTEEEFNAYARRFCGANTDLDRATFKIAWDHHKTYNLHHHQSLKDYFGEDWHYYIVEMVCDWISMGKTMNNTAWEYYEKEKQKVILPEMYQVFLERILTLLQKRQLSQERLKGQA